MAFEDYETKKSVAIVYTGEGKGKTSASIGLLCRGLGHGFKCAYVQFIKEWDVSEHKFFESIGSLYKDKLTFYKGGKGFYNAPDDIGPIDVSKAEHVAAAQSTYSRAIDFAESGTYDLVVCDEINNAVHEGLLTEKQLKLLLASRHEKTSVCVTGRNFPEKLLDDVDIATEMRKMKHHFDENFLANPGIDY